MKHHPLLFSAKMVQAILSGTKTQTRRVVKFPSDFDQLEVEAFGAAGLKYSTNRMHGIYKRLFPKWEIGDRLWVRETFSVSQENEFEAIVYRADKTVVYAENVKKRIDTLRWNFDGIKWKPSIFMPRAASRIMLEITGIRAERLMNISESDAVAESAWPWVSPHGELNYKIGFLGLWDEINGEKSHKFNPFVWVIEFKRV